MKAVRVMHNDITGDKESLRLDRGAFSELSEIHIIAGSTGSGRQKQNNVTFGFHNIHNKEDGFSEEIKITLSEDEIKMLAREIRAYKKKEVA